MKPGRDSSEDARTQGSGFDHPTLVDRSGAYGREDVPPELALRPAAGYEKSLDRSCQGCR